MQPGEDARVAVGVGVGRHLLEVASGVVPVDAGLLVELAPRRLLGIFLAVDDVSAGQGPESLVRVVAPLDEQRSQRPAADREDGQVDGQPERWVGGRVVRREELRLAGPVAHDVSPLVVTVAPSRASSSYAAVVLAGATPACRSVRTRTE